MIHTQKYTSSLIRSFVVALFIAFIPCATLASSNPGGPCWVGTWASSPQLADAKDVPAELLAPSATVQQFVRVSAGGKKIRVRFSNAFGTTPLVISSAHVAIATAVGAVKSGTDKELLFDGKKSV